MLYRNERRRLAMFRRIPAVVALCGLALLIGCADEDLPTEAHRRRPYNNVYVPVQTTLVNETIGVPAGASRSWELALLKGGKLHGEIRSDSDVNIWLLSPREFEAFQNKETFHWHGTASRERTLGFTFTYTIPKTESYYFVADNRFSWLTSKAVSVYLTVTQ